MPTIIEFNDFIVTAHDKPHHSRENGGHIKVTPKVKFVHRQDMPLDLAAGLMHLTMITGEAATKILRQKGLDIVRINYQDNGNWAYLPTNPAPLGLHVHVYMRTTHEQHPDNDPRFQAFPDALVFPPRDSGYYEHFQPLTHEDCEDIRAEVLRLLETPKYDAVLFKR